jgi:hypothetical protein
MLTVIWLVTTLFPYDGKEPTDRLIPSEWKGNPWGPTATRARETGDLPPIRMTPEMQAWDRWARSALRDGDIVFRRADARVLAGRFPFSRFIANVSGSLYSHTGIAAIEKGEPVIYDTTKAGVRRQPFAVWMLDNFGPLGVKRVRPELKSHADEAVRFCRRAYEIQIPFDFDFELGDDALYCVELTEKAYRASGLELSKPVRLGDMERATEYPVCIFVFMRLTKLTLEQAVYFPGNERHGIWSCPELVTVYQSHPSHDGRPAKAGDVNAKAVPPAPEPDKTASRPAGSKS